MADTCYVEQGYAENGYFHCENNSGNASIPSINSGPTFTEKKVKSYEGRPRVELARKYATKEPITYPFVTSIIIDAEQGEPNAPTLINTPEELQETFGYLNNKDYKYAMSFLAYSPSLLVTRCVGVGALNSTSPGFDAIKIDNYEEFREYPEDTFLNNEVLRFIAQTPGSGGNKLRVALFTVEELNENAWIYGQYYAKDLISGMDELCYCMVVFKEDNSKVKVKELFVIPFNDLESINTESKYVYCRLNAYNNFLDGLYDGNENKYSGNLFFGDGDVGKYFYGYDGDLRLLEGQVGLYDGDVFDGLTTIIKKYGSSILKLEKGIQNVPVLSDLEETALELNNTFSYDIDLHIGNNVTLNRPDVVNIVGCPKGIVQAVDFKYVFDNREIANGNKNQNTFFVYGIKSLDNTKIDMSADYAGLRSYTILTEGLGVSSSKVTKTFKLNSLKTNPSIQDMDYLYQKGINVIQNYKGKIFCNGEIIHEETII